MFYATHQSHNGEISENAKILAFETRVAAEAWLLAGYSSGLNPRVVVGEFKGHWRQTQISGPIEAAKITKPFDAVELNVRGPDSSLGNYYAYTPNVEVLVVVDQPLERSVEAGETAV